MKKKIQPIKPFPKTDYNTVLLEDLTSQFRAFGEGLAGLTETVEKMDKKIDKNTTETVFIKADMSEINILLKKMDARLTAVEKKIKSIAIDMSEIRKEIKDIRKSMKDKVDVDAFEYLEERVVRLEKRFAHI